MGPKRRSERVQLQSQHKKPRRRIPSPDPPSALDSLADPQSTKTKQQAQDNTPFREENPDFQTENVSAPIQSPSNSTPRPASAEFASSQTEADECREKEVDIAGTFRTVANLNDAEPNPTEVIIFQCSKCRTMVADSTLGVSVSEDHNTLLMPAASELVISNDCTLSKTGVDAGCGYRNVSCAHCGKCLGRVYESTSPALDHQRGLYILKSSCLITRPIGNGVTTKGDSIDNFPQRLQRITCRSPTFSCPDETSPLSMFQKLKGDYDTLTVKVNSVLDLLKQQMAAIEHFQARTSEFDSKIMEGETTLGHVHNLMLVWDDRIRHIAVLKEEIDKLKQYPIPRECSPQS